MKPIKLSSRTYRITEVRRRTSSRFYKDLQIGTVVKFELSMGIIEKTTKVTIYNLSNGKSYVSPAHMVRAVFTHYSLEEVLLREGWEEAFTNSESLSENK